MSNISTSSSQPVAPVAPTPEVVEVKTEAPELVVKDVETGGNNTASEEAKEQGRYEVENAEDVSPDKVKKAVNEINKKIKPTHTSCQFSYHEETNRISIKVIDDETEEVIREIPPEKTLDMIAKTLELEGILVDEKR
ncbi:MAG: flagellar protein FlaG [Lachnospiraceae bacterium]|nr:flagellar protein FlaG [Lachnospiraceae bacterium]